MKSPIRDGLMTTKTFKDPEKALDWISEIYDSNIQYLREAFDEFSKGEFPSGRVHAYYPYVEITTKKAPVIDDRMSFGFLSRPGLYRTTITRPDLYRNYYIEQFGLLLQNHKDSSLHVGVSQTPIPLHFALGENFFLEQDLSQEQIRKLPQHFDQPDLAIMDDTIADGTFIPKKGEPSPLALFTAPRVDISLQRLKHYTGTNAEHFQKYVIFTNYQFYIDEFTRLGYELMSSSNSEVANEEDKEYSAFVEPGNFITHSSRSKGSVKNEGAKAARMPQMPAYHLKRPDGTGITMVNIGVGPSNAKTITDHVAVLRPHTWLMLGHCAGLRNSQKLGDYVLAHGYMRDDNVLDHAVPRDIPIPQLSEVQISLEKAISTVTGLDEYEQKKFVRTGTIATVSDRNWELWEQKVPIKKLSQCRAVALDMESATIATNGFRFRVPYGTLLCVSDRPLHGQLKLPGMADNFYRERVDQHLKIGLMTMENLRLLGYARVHSRKLRSFSEVAFQ